LEAVLDAAAISPPLRLRAPLAGDSFHPLNSPGRRPLSRQFNDRKVPARDRSTWPVLCDAEGILWAPGLAIAHRARVTPQTRECWRLALVPEEAAHVL
jgi:tRNA(Ile)-lysidine synthase